MSEQGAKQCVLIIDDSPLELRALGMILSDKYNVKLATSGQVGITLAKKNAVDLILLDLNMPEMSGFEVLLLLKDDYETAHIPVVMLTSSESANDEVRGLALGASDFIRKPYADAVVNYRIELQLKLVAQMKMIEQFSLIDGLTGVNNRRSFDRFVRSAWSQSTRKEEWLSMLIIDIDRFKVFNDTYGHINGDTCLKAVSDIMVNTVMRGSDLVFRWGGEEFAIILPDTHLEGALEVAERIRKNIEKTPIYFEDKSAFITASIGVGAIIPPTNQNYDEAFREFHTGVDKALYQAKSNGRNRVEVSLQ